MNDLKTRISTRALFTDATPDSTISIIVLRKSLQSATSDSLRKRDWHERCLPLPTRRRVFVEASEYGTADSILFAPERPNANESHQRVAATEFIKVNQNTCSDVVRHDDDFEVSFIGLSVAQQDYIGDNEMLLCSLARREDHQEVLEYLASSAYSTINSSNSSVDAHKNGTEEDVAVRSDVGKTNERDGVVPIPPKQKTVDLSDLPTALPIRPGDVTFLHFDPETDGHDTGSEPDTFTPIPGTKRLFIQRRGSASTLAEGGNVRDVSIRFTVMEIDKLNEEQLIAIKSLEEVAKSVGKAASSVPILKFISWLLKFANTVGRSALKKVARPDHVMSSDVSFMLAEPEVSSNDGRTIQREEYGNYLRYGYYFFLFSPVDAKLHAQTDASTHNVQLLIKHHGYRAKMANLNEKEYFPLSGVSYVVIKVTRGCSPCDNKQRSEMFARHLGRLTQLLKKYTGTLGSVTAFAVGNAYSETEKKEDHKKSA
ncbi:hypothetical protein BWQ96_10356 [Gracilariopsis chorda]|uniref:Uncharacterized protein n=1 Tax=Gracilariopsis chorda TaxID=448386 RepID=A0A2V3ID24_9FLOR|nr:hypothetical protein BWQ96_10356 [Gracilariopsis chorda]|eukprot:PXF39938.1 hypothetical protein BWQ96_10356 [Gracilariopsis chorda]